eukprot:GHVS01085420.1.p1 GENE.GHVS01085420.1~~GHVS01085420.1.p1  ORF type:complete len:1054 (-),score=128.71 GHVS01085420.1:638-3799(-)
MCGWFMGVRLKDMGDYVVKHYVHAHTPLSVVKVWEIKQFDEDADGLVDTSKVIYSRILAPVVRGSPYITMLLPVGHVLVLDTLMQNLATGGKNNIQQITNFAGVPTEPVQSCSSLQKGSVRTDALHVGLRDGTKWIVLMNRMVELSCEVGKSSDRLLSIDKLSAPLTVRLAVLDMCDHIDLYTDSTLPDVPNTCNSKHARNISYYRWRLMSVLNTLPERRMDKLADYMNSLGAGDAMFEKLFTKYPLKEQLLQLQLSTQYGGFEIQEVPWEAAKLLEALRNTTVPADALLVPDQFVLPSSTDGALGVTAELKEEIKTEFIWKSGKSFVAVGGMVNGGATHELFKQLLDIDTPAVGVMNPQVDQPAHRRNELDFTPPYFQDVGPPYTSLPEGLPSSLPFPQAYNADLHAFRPSNNTIEMVSNTWYGWPFKTYCKPGMGKDSCAGAVATFYYMGNGGASWLGMDWGRDVLPEDSTWCALLMRHLWAGVCSKDQRTGGICSPLKKIILIENPQKAQLAKMFQQYSESFLDNVGKVELNKLRNFMRGTFEEHTSNVGNPYVTAANEDEETLADFVLRHALTYPLAGDIELDAYATAAGSQPEVAGLRYKFYVMSLASDPGLFHSLHPPYDNKTDDFATDQREMEIRLNGDSWAPMWPSDRTMVYINTLQHKLEYRDTTHVPSGARPPSLEDDQTTCLVTSHGNVCGRSFAFRSVCNPASPLFHGGRSCGSALSPMQEGSHLRNYLSGWGVPVEPGWWAYMERGGVPSQMMINMPSVTWDKTVRNATGWQIPLNELVPPIWKEKIRWAVKQDMRGPIRLEPVVLHKEADDISEWIRSMHRYAQLAIISDFAELPQERDLAVNWLKIGLQKMLTSQFDNILLFDRTWGGIVPCGCDRKEGKERCAPSPRLSLDRVVSLMRDRPAILATACPALRSDAVEAGAGFYYGTHLLFGHFVYAAAVVSRFSPTWLNHRVHVTTPQGIFRPKIHYLILGLIRQFATPDFLPAYTGAAGDLLQRYFVSSRHKDWWYLNSYSTGFSLLASACHPTPTPHTCCRDHST